MSNLPDQPSSPTLFGYAERLRAEQQQYASPRAYADAVEQRMAREHSEVIDFIRNLGHVIEPDDPLLGVDDQRLVTKTFVTGGSLGFQVMKYHFDRRVEDKLAMATETIDVTVSEEDPREAAFAVAGEIIDIGQRGFAHAGPYQEIVEDWEDSLSPLVATQPYLKSGFGFMVRMAVIAIDLEEEQARAKDLKAMELEAAAGINLDDLNSFMESLNNDPSGE